MFKSQPRQIVCKSLSQKSPSQKRVCGMAQGVGPEFKLLGKTPTKKAQEKTLTSIEQSLMAGPNCQAAQGKDGTAGNLGQAWLL
jgi:hypothetical protein